MFEYVFEKQVLFTNNVSIQFTIIFVKILNFFFSKEIFSEKSKEHQSLRWTWCRKKISQFILLFWGTQVKVNWGISVLNAFVGEFNVCSIFEVTCKLEGDRKPLPKAVIHILCINSFFVQINQLPDLFDLKDFTWFFNISFSKIVTKSLLMILNLITTLTLIKSHRLEILMYVRD